MTKKEASTSSRRSLLTGSAALVAGGVLGGTVTAYAAMPETPNLLYHGNGPS
jgi:hypothetical protein